MINSKTTTKGQSSAIELVLIIPVIIAAIIVFILLVPNYSYSAGSEVNAFQLNAMAQSLLEYIITNPGNPPNWGLNASQLSSFGLAVPNQPYHLDPFKVMALEYWGFANGYLPSNLQGYCNTSQVATGFANYLNQHGINYLAINGYWLILPSGGVEPWLLNYTEVKQMLGLGSNYEFMLIIQPVLNISVTSFPPSGPNNFNLYIKVMVMSNGQPVGDANVGVQYFITDQAGNDLACQYNLVRPCTPVPSGVQLPPSSSFTVISKRPLIIIGTASSVTNSSGVATITLPISYDGDNTYFMLITASIGGLQDYAYYQYPSQTTPLLTVGIIPNSTNYNSVVFVDSHVVSNCLYNTRLLTNPSQTALGLRIVAVYKTLYGYTFESLNFTLSNGSKSYPIPCISLAQSQSNYSTCYWNLPNTPMLLIVNVIRNSQGPAGQVPIAQSIIVPYGLYPNYLLGDEPIIFGRSIRNAPVGVARALVYIGDSAYYITLYLYYKGNVFGAAGW